MSAPSGSESRHSRQSDPDDTALVLVVPNSPTVGQVETVHVPRWLVVEWWPVLRRWAEDHRGRGGQQKLEGAWLALRAIQEAALPHAEAETGGASADGASSGHERITTAQAADRLGVTSRRVTQLCRESRLQADRDGRDWLIDPMSVDEYRDRRTMRSA